MAVEKGSIWTHYAASAELFIPPIVSEMSQPIQIESIC